MTHQHTNPVGATKAVALAREAESSPLTVASPSYAYARPPSVVRGLKVRRPKSSLRRI